MSIGKPITCYNTTNYNKKDKQKEEQANYETTNRNANYIRRDTNNNTSMQNRNKLLRWKNKRRR